MNNFVEEKNVFEKFDLDCSNLKFSEKFQHFDGGELFFEDTCADSLVLSNGIIKVSDFSNYSGFSLRCFARDKVYFVHSSEVSMENVRRALDFDEKFLKNTNSMEKISVQSMTHTNDFFDAQHAENFDFAGFKSSQYADKSLEKSSLYFSGETVSAAEKIALLKEIDAYVRSKLQNVLNVTVSLAASCQNIGILNVKNILTDSRPLIRLSISVVAEKNSVRETGFGGFGGRYSFSEIKNNWKKYADNAVRQVLVNLDAKESPSGELPVVLSNGWTGVLLHEAVGHGLEADFNRKKTSVFSSKIGSRVASECVTVVDDGTIPLRRGSLNFDDEGTKTTRNVLIENGILKNYMYDNLNAKLMGSVSSGNGRRQNYKSLCIPRMTNTFMEAGDFKEEELIASVKYGIFTRSFSGGQVDITSGKFTFSSQEAYLIENGKISHPVKGATLIGDGKTVLQRISMVADNFALDDGVGTCGKDGQMVPVSVGEPSVKIDKITVGGTL